MRFDAKGALFVLLLCSSDIRPRPAQERGQEQGKRVSASGTDRVMRKGPDEQPTVPRLLTPNEGLVLLRTALSSRHHHAGFSSDCSHFVHGLYERAGLPYEYASSWDLYEGTTRFRRVRSPQPGDLAVWRGHAGIVVNPAQHSFFSVLHSGPGVDSYDSPYWKRRGWPRFFRYLKPGPRGVLNTSLPSALRIRKEAKAEYTKAQ
jgi:cell wall-associated NlpC family hydrolase